MNCNDSRKHFYAFIDGELDVEKNIEVLAHLDMCYECSLRIERERLIQEKVKETVCTVNAPPYLEREILRGVERKPDFFTLLKKNLLSRLRTPHRQVRSRLAPLAGIATVMIVLIVYFFATQSNLQEKSDALLIAESKYHDYVMKQAALDMPSRSVSEIAEYLQNQTGLSVTLPGIRENVQLVGATVTEINGVKVPLAFYMHDDVPIVLLIACNSDIDFTRMKEIAGDKAAVYTAIGSCGSCQIIGWMEADNQYVMVSNLNSEKMLRILTNV